MAGSLIGTFGVMYLCGYNLDNLSLMALTIATGFVVDDAIVVLENTTRHMEAGASAMVAAITGSKEIGFTVLSMSTSLVAVFIPILLMGGMVGRLFREFAVTLSTAIAVSLALSLTTTPMMCARLLRPGKGREHGHIYRFSENTFDGMRHYYDITLRWALRHPRLMLLIVVVTVATNVYVFSVIPKGFFPEQDTGRISGTIQADQDVSFQSMKGKLTQILGIIGERPRRPVHRRLHRGQRRGRHACQYRPHVHLPQTFRSAQDKLDPVYRKAPQKACRSAGGPHVPPARPGHPRRRKDRPMPCTSTHSRATV